MAQDKPAEKAEAAPAAKAAPAKEHHKRFFHGYPKTKFHPVHGRVVVNDPDEEAHLYPPHDFFDTPEEADAHRTDREAGIAVANNMLEKVEDHKKTHGVVRNSVQAQESIDKGNVGEPL